MLDECLFISGKKNTSCHLDPFDKKKKKKKKNERKNSLTEYNNQCINR